MGVYMHLKYTVFPFQENRLILNILMTHHALMGMSKFPSNQKLSNEQFWGNLFNTKMCCITFYDMAWACLFVFNIKSCIFGKCKK